MVASLALVVFSATTLFPYVVRPGSIYAAEEIESIKEFIETYDPTVEYEVGSVLLPNPSEYEEFKGYILGSYPGIGEGLFEDLYGECGGDKFCIERGIVEYIYRMSSEWSSESSEPPGLRGWVDRHISGFLDKGVGNQWWAFVPSFLEGVSINGANFADGIIEGAYPPSPWKALAGPFGGSLLEGGWSSGKQSLGTLFWALRNRDSALDLARAELDYVRGQDWGRIFSKENIARGVFGDAAMEGYKEGRTDIAVWEGFLHVFGGVWGDKAREEMEAGRYGRAVGIAAGETFVVLVPFARVSKVAKSDLYWTSWREYEKVSIGSHQYAKIGDRLYTEHAVERMLPRGFGGRSIAPSFIEDVIRTGTATTGIRNGVRRTIFRSGSVEVVTEEGGRIVVSVNPFKYKK